MSNATCSGIGCERPVDVLKHSLCKMHYQRLRKHGDANWQPPTPATGCKVPGCDRPHASNGYCGTHDMRVRRTGTADDPKPFEPSECSIEGCSKVASQRGWCGTHYTRFRRNGSPYVVQRERNTTPPDECTIDGCSSTHHARGLCLDHYRQEHHLRNREERNQRAKANYEADKDYYNLKAARRRRKVTEGMTEEDLVISTEYRKAIKGDACNYCGAPGEHTDHIFPVRKGGRDYWYNLTRACSLCNSRKAAHCGTWFKLRTGVDVDRRLPAVA